MARCSVAACGALQMVLHATCVDHASCVDMDGVPSEAVYRPLACVTCSPVLVELMMVESA